MAANAGRAVFEAVGNFQGLIGESKKASRALDETAKAGRGIGGSIPADGGNAGRGVKSISERAGVMSQKMDSAGKKMSLGLTLPIVGFGVASVKTFASFERSLTSAGLKAGANEAQMKRMKDLAMQLGADTAFSSSEAANGFDILAASGMNAEQAMGALPGVLMAAQASGEDLGMTAETVAQSMNAFNLSSDKAPHVADVFAQAANTTALNMQGLGEAMAHAGQLGATANQDLEGVVAVVGRMVDMGVPAASAGAAIRQAIGSLMAPGKKAAGIINGLGIETRDATGKMLKLPVLLKNFDKAFDSSNPKMKAYARETGLTGQALKDYAMKNVFGVEGAKAFGLALSDGKPLLIDTATEVDKMTALQKGLAKVMGGPAADAWIKARTKMGVFTASGADAVTGLDAMGRGADGVSKKFGDAFSKTTDMKIKAFFGSLENLAIVLIDSVAPALKDITDGATSFLNKIGEFMEIPGMGPLIIGVGLLLAALGPVLIVLSKIITAFRVVSSLGGKFKRPKGGSDQSSSDGLPGGASNKVQVWWASSLPVHLTGGKGSPGATPQDSNRPLPPGTYANPAPGAMQGPMPASRASRMRPMLRSAGRTAGRAGAAGLGGAAYSMLSGGSAGDAVKSAGMFAGVELAIEGVSKTAAKLGPKIAAGFRAAGPGIKSFAAASASALGGFAKGAGSFLKTAVMVGAKWIWMGLQALLGAAKMAIAWIIGMGPIGWVIAAVVALVILIVANWNTVKRWTMIVFGAILGFLRVVWSGIKAAVGAAVRFVWLIISTYFRLVLAFWTMVWNAIKTVAVTIWSGILAAVRTAVGLVRAVISTGLAVIRNVWNSVWSTLSGAVSTAFGAVRSIISGAWDFISGIFGRITGGISRIVGAGAKLLSGDFSGAVQALGFSKGGLVPGAGSGDIVDAKLEPGEFVLTKDAVKRIGIPVLTGLNRGGAKMVPKLGMAVLQGREAGRVTQTRQMTGVAAGVPSPVAPPAGPKAGKTIEFNTTIVNPKPETASGSLARTYGKIAYLGLDARDE